MKFRTISGGIKAPGRRRKSLNPRRLWSRSQTGGSWARRIRSVYQDEGAPGGRAVNPGGARQQGDRICL